MDRLHDHWGALSVDSDALRTGWDILRADLGALCGDLDDLRGDLDLPRNDLGFLRGRLEPLLNDLVALPFDSRLLRGDSETPRISLVARSGQTSRPRTNVGASIKRGLLEGPRMNCRRLDHRGFFGFFPPTEDNHKNGGRI